MPTPTIAITSPSRGSGVSLTTFAFSALLHRRGHRVLAVDLSSTFSLSRWCAASHRPRPWYTENVLSALTGLQREEPGKSGGADTRPDDPGAGQADDQNPDDQSTDDQNSSVHSDQSGATKPGIRAAMYGQCALDEAIVTSAHGFDVAFASGVGRLAYDYPLVDPEPDALRWNAGALRARETLRPVLEAGTYDYILLDVDGSHPYWLAEGLHAADAVILTTVPRGHHVDLFVQQLETERYPEQNQRAGSPQRRAGLERADMERADLQRPSGSLRLGGQGEAGAPLLGVIPCQINEDMDGPYARHLGRLEGYLEGIDHNALVPASCYVPSAYDLTWQVAEPGRAIDPELPEMRRWNRALDALIGRLSEVQPTS